MPADSDAPDLLASPAGDRVNGNDRPAPVVPPGGPGSLTAERSASGEASGVGDDGHSRVRLAELREAPLSVDEVLAAVADPRAGGVSVFVGAVRDDDGGRAVERLDYSAHPTAAVVLREVAARAASADGVVAVAAVHRTGALVIGDLAVVVAASAVHRAEAFAACRQLIDELKHEVPVWKHQYFADGTQEWVAAC
jgi:molybdopterin synthase catalytic subunit